MQIGCVKSLGPSFGFIKYNGFPEIFFHVSALGGYKVRHGEVVEFEFSSDHRGRRCAVNIRPRSKEINDV